MGCTHRIWTKSNRIPHVSTQNGTLPLLETPRYPQLDRTTLQEAIRRCSGVGAQGGEEEGAVLLGPGSACGSLLWALVDSVGVCSMDPDLIFGVELVCAGIQIKGPPYCMWLSKGFWSDPCTRPRIPFPYYNRFRVLSTSYIPESSLENPYKPARLPT